MGVVIANQGTVGVPAGVPVVIFEDVNRDGRFDPDVDTIAGQATLASIAMGQVSSHRIIVTGQVRFLNAPLSVVVDPDNRISELDESNNIDHYGTFLGQYIKLYTSSTDFNAGNSINIQTLNDELKLADTARAFNNIWIANSGRGTVLKVDIQTGKVLGEYHSAPDGMGKNPSRTTVDKDGNVWVANRNESGAVAANAIAPGLPASARGMGSIIKIGLEENGQCIDRNGNGVIDTSSGLGDVRGWRNNGNADRLGGVSTAEDECLLHYVRVNSTGTRHISVDRHNQVWVNGWSARYFDQVSSDGRVIRQEPYLAYGGYGGLIDANDVIWSSSNGSLLRWDTQNPLIGPSGINWQLIQRNSYGLCIDNQGNVWDSRGSAYRPDGSLLLTYQGGSQGCAVDSNDHVWVANGSHVAHFTNQGVFVGNVFTGATGGTTGLSTDANGKVWAVGGSRYVRIDPSAGPMGADGATPIGVIDLTGPDLGPGSFLYNYSDMTGSTLSGQPQTGRWSVVYDSGQAGTPWGMVNWHGQVQGDGRITVMVAASDDCVTFSAPVTISSGHALAGVPGGRCLQTTVMMVRASTGESPVLYDLMVRPALPDLTASHVRATVPAVGQTRLEASIGNASPFDAAPFRVSFWEGDPATGGMLLGEAHVASMPGGTAQRVGLANAVAISLGTEVYVQADSADQHHEYDENNNWASGPLASRSIAAQLVVRTDKPVYEQRAPVGLGAAATNTGDFDANFTLQLSIQDEQGLEVARFADVALEMLLPLAPRDQSQPWNTASIPPGNYMLRGVLLDAAGNISAMAQTEFAVNAQTGAAHIQPVPTLMSWLLIFLTLAVAMVTRQGLKLGAR